MINENNVLKEDKMKNIKNKLMNLKYVSTQVKQEILFDVAIDLVSNLNTILNRAYCGEFEAYNSREIRKAFETIDEFDEAAENLERSKQRDLQKRKRYLGKKIHDLKDLYRCNEERKMHEACKSNAALIYKYELELELLNKGVA